MQIFLRSVAWLCCLTGAVFAQNQDDALRYSLNRFGGTAASAGLAGSNGALGADFTSTVLNPAGLGLYRRNEFTITPSLDYQTANAQYYGTSERDGKTNFNISNLGIVLHSPAVNRMKTSGWLSSTFAFGLSRISNLGGRFVARGINPESSLADAMVSAANGKSIAGLDPFYEGLGYQGFLFDPIPSTNQFANNNGPRPGFGGQQQRMVVDRRGAISEWNISYAGNYSDKFYLGASLGLRRMVFKQDYALTETDVADTIANFQQWRYRTTFSDRGSGVTLRLGAIYKFSDAFRAGMSASIPVLFNLSSEYSSSIRAEFSQLGNHEAFSPNGVYDFRLNTPARAAVQGAYLFDKNGLITAEIEAVNYASARFRTGDGALDATNDRIAQTFRPAINLKLGAEKRMDDIYLRAGFARFGNPYQSAAGIDGTNNHYTIGGGFREELFYIDIAVIFTSQNEVFYAYDKAAAPVKAAEIRNNRFTSLITLGTRF